MFYKCLTFDENRLLSEQQKRILANHDSTRYQSEARWIKRNIQTYGYDSEVELVAALDRDPQRRTSNRDFTAKSAIDNALADYRACVGEFAPDDGCI